MYIEYKTPEGQYSEIYESILNAGHTLIAGAQGSGKSVLMTGLIHTALYHSPAKVQFILIDPKLVDMVEYRDLPHVLKYATEPDQIAAALRYAVTIMDLRFKEMQAGRWKEYRGSMLYIFIDEMADLMTDKAVKKEIAPLIQRLAQKGRAARITVIMASQCCLRTVIDTAIKCNFPSRIALRTATAQDSRNIIDQKGAEMLPNPRTEGRAFGIWRNGADTAITELHRYDDAERQRIIDHWTNKQNSKKRFSLFGRKSA